MVFFAPIPAAKASSGICVELEAAPALADHPAPRELERLITQACFHAACAATGCSTAHQLEKCYSPEGIQYNVDWPKGRKYVWHGMQKNGSPAVRPALARNSRAVVARLAEVRAKSDLVDRTLSQSLWRHLDPHSLSVSEIVRVPIDAGDHKLPMLHGALLTRRLCREFVSRMRATLWAPQTRQRSLNALWYYIRRAEVDADLPLYVLSYLLWKEGRPAVTRDLVLGPIAAALYAYASHWFGHLALDTPIAAGDEAPLAFLGMYGIETIWDGSRRVVHVDAAALHVVDPAGPFQRQSIFF